MERRNRLVINLDNVDANINLFQSFQKNKTMIGVVKANGYGCGDLHITQELINLGIDFIAVSSLSEAMHIRGHFKDVEILVLGVIFKEDLQVAKDNNIIVTVPSYDWCVEAHQQLQNIRVHIKLDTGMNRLGCKSELELKHCLSILLEKQAHIEGVFTHFATSDAQDDSVSNQQFKRFRQMVESVDYSFQWIHCDNTDASIKFKEDFTNAFRVGIGMYGFSSSKLRLFPSVSLMTRIVSCKSVTRGEKVSYGLTHTFAKNGYVCTLPIGYADGILRINQNRKVYIDGRYYDIVGRICMDQMMIFSDKPFSRGVDVEIFGPHIPLTLMAQELNTIPYEILCCISDRVPRYYTRNNRIVDDAIFRKQ